ncbi:MAG: hypothetical protein FJ139_01600 [Deltaproteobacteria bacterium]|nr:hypothetical protein [Deltaproteobacteria bacterium]
MIRINLLPYREKEKKEGVARQVVILAGTLILFLIVVGSVQLYMSMKISSLEASVKEQEEKLAKLTKVIGDIEGFKKDKAVLEKKLGIINNLEANRLAPVIMLDELTKLVPTKDVWLDRLSEKGKDLMIEGTARNNIAVAHFMKNLAGASFIKSVDLVSTREKDVSGVKLQLFIISCVKKG